ncbi:hypothetical protein EYF80_029636 [Liparis tanakae]|uniref:Uncharacterized protein n=1 Tax=Liparis tanakae TaxID=230148 RepID=A0A4Z2H471_9TELE|nr:hypothetical protein EYF80_029636 [Liparis tanakae]
MDECSRTDVWPAAAAAAAVVVVVVVVVVEQSSRRGRADCTTRGPIDGGVMSLVLAGVQRDRSGAEGGQRGEGRARI